MAYNRKNYINRAQYIISVYEAYKYEDVPDTNILRLYFPKHGIFLNYRQWMNIKALVLPRSGRHQITPFYNSHIQRTNADK